MIDTHCHLTYPGMGDRVAEVVAAAAAAGVDRMVTIGTSPPDAVAAVALSKQFPGVFAAVGLHPHHSHEWRDRDTLIHALRASFHEPGAKVVALGEMGLDYHYPEPPRNTQRQSLEWQLELAKELSAIKPMPIIIHNREATADTLAVLRASGIPANRFDFHCFTGPPEDLTAILDFGAMVGFTGIITFKNAKYLADLAANVPLNRLFIETDAPYLTPEPYRKIKVNEPRYVAEVAKFLAARRNMSVDDFTAATDANAECFFGLPPGK